MFVFAGIGLVQDPELPIGHGSGYTVKATPFPRLPMSETVFSFGKMSEVVGQVLLEMMLTHQKSGVMMMLAAFMRPMTHHGLLMACKMGTGKTLQALVFAMVVLNLVKTRAQTTEGYNNVLVLVPPKLLQSSWRDEIENKWKPLMIAGGVAPPNIIYINGPKDAMAYNAASIGTNTLVIASNSLFTHLTGRKEKHQVNEQDPERIMANAPWLWQTDWALVVAEEAHAYKNPKGKKFICLQYLAMRARFIVHLTGTPIMNKERDMLVLANMLLPSSIEPFPIDGDRQAMMDAAALVHDTYMLRREKEGSYDAVKTTVKFVDMTPIERHLYDTVASLAQEEVARLGKRNGAGIASMNLITRLRLLVNDYSLLYDSLEKKQMKDGDAAVPSLKKQREWVEANLPGLDAEDVDDAFVRVSYRELNASPSVFTLGELEKKGLPRAVLGGGPGSKITFACNLIREMLIKDASSPVIVFTLFVGVQDLMMAMFDRMGIKHAHLRGDMKEREQEAAIRAAKNNAVHVFLIMMQSGCQGLNLQNCNRGVMMEPSWVPAMEEQAIGRMNRLGQTKEVEIVRMVMRDTVEERAMAIQDGKIDLVAELLKDTALSTLLLGAA